MELVEQSSSHQETQESLYEHAVSMTRHRYQPSTLPALANLCASGVSAQTRWLRHWPPGLPSHEGLPAPHARHFRDTMLLVARAAGRS